MENASKALVMAGGIMIAIIVISTLLYASSTWGIIPQKQSETKKVDQIAEFNLDFESYDRQAVYGVDLISVISKADENNIKYNVQNNSSDPMYIDISFHLINSVDTVETTKKVYLDGRTPEKSITKSNTILNGGSTYSLSGNYSVVKTFIQNVQSQTTKGRKRTDEAGKYQEFITTQAGGSEFKTRVFACTKVDYNTETGRIKAMYFEEQDTSFIYD